MPRSLSAALEAQVEASESRSAFLIELNLSSTIRLTDWYTQVTYDSNDYEPGGSFITLDSATETGQLQVDELNIQFSNVTSQVRSLVKDGAFTDKIVDVYLAYFGSGESIVGAINYFTGQIRSVSISENIESSTLTMTVASHWSNWNLTKGRHFSDESQQAFSSGDKGMEFATQVKDDVRWGM
jgi:hypothetical protein